MIIIEADPAAHLAMPVEQRMRAIVMSFRHKGYLLRATPDRLEAIEAKVEDNYTWEKMRMDDTINAAAVVVRMLAKK